MSGVGWHGQRGGNVKRGGVYSRGAFIEKSPKIGGRLFEGTFNRSITVMFELKINKFFTYHKPYVDWFS